MKTFRSLQLNLWSARVLRLVVALCASLIAACGGGYGGGSSGMGGMSTSAPMITMQPASQSVTAPTAAMFSVAASNPTGYSGTLTYQWMRQGSGMTGFTAISGATASSYTTPATSMSDNGSSFKVQVTNAYGTTTSNAAMLTVM
jgi:beta-galactosidase